MRNRIGICVLAFAAMFSSGFGGTKSYLGVPKEAALAVVGTPADLAFSDVDVNAEIFQCPILYLILDTSGSMRVSHASQVYPHVFEALQNFVARCTRLEELVIVDGGGSIAFVYRGGAIWDEARKRLIREKIDPLRGYRGNSNSDPTGGLMMAIEMAKEKEASAGAIGITSIGDEMTISESDFERIRTHLAAIRSVRPICVSAILLNHIQPATGYVKSRVTFRVGMDILARENGGSLFEIGWTDILDAYPDKRLPKERLRNLPHIKLGF